jgi:DNA-3-methyladenine glycosylase
MRLTKDYYLKYQSTELAKRLLGKLLVHESPEGRTSGIIVETESYLDTEPAAHSFVGITNRTRTIYENDPGTSYVYFIYGMYSCFNVVSNIKGSGDAVLIRALEPVDGVELMLKRRNSYLNKTKVSKTIDSNNYKTKNTDKIIRNLCSGPGKLCVAMGIERLHNRIKLYDKNSNLWLEEYKDYEEDEILTTTRVGITKAADLPLRFYVKDSKFISVK